MFDFQKVFLDHFDPKTFLNYRWNVRISPAEVLVWQGFYTGPLVLREYDIEDLCELLLGIDLPKLAQVVAQELQPVASVVDVETSVFMHSTTPDLNAFQGDLDKLYKELPGLDYTTYKETRAVYFAKKGDLSIGRVNSWATAVKTDQIDAIDIENTDYYYLSHALLVLAKQHLTQPVPQINALLDFLMQHPHAVVRLYALEQEMQIFLVWLKRLAQLNQLKIDSNNLEISQNWNSKNVIYPSVQQALKLELKTTDFSPKELLKAEAQYSILHKELGILLPTLPGYVIERADKSSQEFIEQVLQAARLLHARYQLSHGCLKAANSGDGSRITPQILLTDADVLRLLAEQAYQYGDDYILEAQVTYLQTEVGGLQIKTTPSAHIRQGGLATGITLQFMEGTSWKGNVYLDAEHATAFDISSEHYQAIMEAMQALHEGFRKQISGLSIAGIDFAIGRVGGRFGDEVILGIQDPNISFNGAECLRVFLEKVNGSLTSQTSELLHGATLVVRPDTNYDLPEIRQILKKCFPETAHLLEVITAIPDCWGMIAAAGQTPTVAIERVAALRKVLIEQGAITDGYR